MTEVTSQFTGTTEGRERNGWKGESSEDCRKLSGMVQTWPCSSSQTRAAVTGKVGSRQPFTTDDQWWWWRCKEKI